MTNAKLTIVLGMLSTLGYCVSSAFSRVFVGNLLINLDPFTLCFYTFSIGTAFFIFFNITNIKKLYMKSVTCKRNVLFLNITTASSWLFLVWPLKYIEPSVVSILNFGLGPLIGILLNILNKVIN